MSKSYGYNRAVMPQFKPYAVKMHGRYDQRKPMVTSYDKQGHMISRPAPIVKITLSERQKAHREKHPNDRGCSVTMKIKGSVQWVATDFDMEAYLLAKEEEE